jgi:two-component system response regulator AtoC
MRLMQRYDWPGNIRQLENRIRGYVLIGSEEVLGADLVASVQVGSTRLNTEIDLSSPISLKKITKEATQDLERQIILKVLEANGWSRRKTAKWLNISYRSLLYKLQASQVSGLPETPPEASLPASTDLPAQTWTAPKKVEPM